MKRIRLVAAIEKRSDGGPYPYALLSGVAGHALVYFPVVRRQHFRLVWKYICDLLDEECKQPRIGTIQLALLDLVTRPNEAHARNCITLARVCVSFWSTTE